MVDLLTEDVPAFTPGLEAQGLGVAGPDDVALGPLLVPQSCEVVVTDHTLQPLGPWLHMRRNVRRLEWPIAPGNLGNLFRLGQQPSLSPAATAAEQPVESTLVDSDADGHRYLSFQSAILHLRRRMHPFLRAGAALKFHGHDLLEANATACRTDYPALTHGVLQPTGELRCQARKTAEKCVVHGRHVDVEDLRRSSQGRGRGRVTKLV